MSSLTITPLPDRLTEAVTSQESFSIAVPGSKSHSNRALIIAAQRSEPTVLTNVSNSKDTFVLCEGLKKLGVVIEKLAPTTFQIKGGSERFTAFKGTIDIGHAGTSMRFLTTLCATIEGAEITLTGSKRMQERPIGDLVNALRELGAEIEYGGNEGYPPLLIRGKTLTKKQTTLPSEKSSQLASSLLLSSNRFVNGLEITIPGKQISQSFIQMTLECLKDFGIAVENNDFSSYHVAPGQSIQEPQKLVSTEYAHAYLIEGDAAGASYFWGISALTGLTLTIPSLTRDSIQGDMEFLSLLEAIGCTVRESVNEHGIPCIAVERTALQQPSSTLWFEETPDTAQTLAVIAASIPGTMRFEGLSTLRIKETDRIAAICKELGKAGITTEEGDDWLSVTGGTARRASIATYEDHRMAMAFALLGFSPEGITIEHPEVVEKSFPEFWKELQKLPVMVTEHE